MQEEPDAFVQVPEFGNSFPNCAACTEIMRRLTGNADSVVCSVSNPAII